MASVPFTAWPEETREIEQDRAVFAPATASRLSALEWSIVAMAERDSLASLREPGRFAAALGSVFGLSPPNRLASPRLEALRRVAVHVWRNQWNVPKSELDAFVDTGFTLDQYELIQASIHKSRADARRRRAAR
uniref:hypothetical protein n=1 Tax=uncultured Sphingomonas sp. TaxID=158754 RepID=UPI0025FC9064|nr:hypothetical protein [uncultured Sphingomonas sp.]